MTETEHQSIGEPDNQMPLIIVPRDHLEIATHLSAEAQENIHKKRSSLFDALRGIAGFYDQVKQLTPGNLYRLEVPSGEVLQMGKDEFYRGVFYGKRGIQEHAQFSMATASVMDMAKALGTQCLLIKISMQLGKIEGLIDQVLQGQRNDRIADIKAGITIYEDSILSRPETRRLLLPQAIAKLHGGISKCLLDLREETSKLPNVSNNWWQAFLRQWHPWADLEKNCNERIRPIRELCEALASGFHALSRCYIEIDEPETARQALGRIIRDLYDADVQRVERYARQLSLDGEEKALRHLKYFRQSEEMASLLGFDKPQPIYIEFQTTDILNEQ